MQFLRLYIDVPLKALAVAQIPLAACSPRHLKLEIWGIGENLKARGTDGCCTYELGGKMHSSDHIELEGLANNRYKAKLIIRLFSAQRLMCTFTHMLNGEAGEPYRASFLPRCRYCILLVNHSPTNTTKPRTEYPRAPRLSHIPVWLISPSIISNHVSKNPCTW